MAEACTHIEKIHPAKPKSKGCEQCLNNCVGAQECGQDYFLDVALQMSSNLC